MIRVVVVDDQTLVRQGITGLLALGEDIEVLAEASDGREGLREIEEHRPDVVLLDLRMPRFDGIWLLDALRERDWDLPVLVLTTFDDDELVLAAVRAGARGYLLKDVSLDQVLGAVRTLAGGGTLLQPAITERVMRAIRSDAVLAPEIVLTERERDVLGLMAAGNSNREIADALVLAEGTVKNHVSAVLLKLGVRDRTAAVLKALRDGVIGG